MPTDSGTAVFEESSVAPQPFAVRFYSAAADYWALTKPEINFLIAIATFTGFYLGCPAQLHGFSTVLVASSAAAPNQYDERHFDAQMRRTARRPSAAGRLEPSSALWFGVLMYFAGTIYLSGGRSHTGEPACDPHPGELPEPVHTAQTKDASMYGDLFPAPCLR